MSSLVIAILSGLGAMVGWGMADFFAKKTIDVIGDVTTLFWSQAIGVLPLVGLFFFRSHVPVLHHFDPLFIVLFGIVSGLSYLPLYAGFGKGQVSLLSPIFASYAAVVAVLSGVFFGEVMSGLRIIAIVVVFAGVLLMSTDLKDLRKFFKKRNKKIDGLRDVLSGMIVYSFWLVLFDHFINGKDWIPFLLAIRICGASSIYIYAKIRHQSLRIKIPALWKFLIMIGLFDVFAFSSLSYGFSHTHLTSVVAVLGATFSLPTVLLARVFLREKVSTAQYAAIGVILAGVALVSLS